MLKMANIGESSRRQVLQAAGWRVSGGVGANCVCRFVVVGENVVRACAKSWLLTHDARWMLRRTTPPMDSGLLQAGWKGVREGWFEGVLGAQVPGGEARAQWTQRRRQRAVCRWRAGATSKPDAVDIGEFPRLQNFRTRVGDSYGGWGAGSAPKF